MSLDLPWWASLKHGGLFLSAPRLADLFTTPAPAIPLYLVARLRGDLQRLAESPEDASAQKALIDTVLHDIAGLGDTDTTNWQRGNDVQPRFTRRAASGSRISASSCRRNQVSCRFAYCRVACEAACCAS